MGGEVTEDILGFNDGNGITLIENELIKNGSVIGTFDLSNGLLFIRFTDSDGEIPTNDDVNSIMQQIVYSNSSATPPPSVTLTWLFSDGNTASAQGDGGRLTVVDSITVTIVAVNDSPVISSAAEVSVLENQISVLTVTSTDADGDSPFYSISGGEDAALFSINEDDGDLTFNSPPDFDAPQDSDNNNVYELTVQVSDGNGSTDSQNISVTVTNVNEDPIITSANSVFIEEGQLAVLTVTSSDVDGDIPIFEIIGGDDAALFSLDESNGELSFVVAPDFEDPNDFDSDNVYNVTILVSDGNGGSDLQNISVVVTNSNENPVITSAALENVVENQTSILTVTSMDVDGGIPQYSIIGGSDEALFSINSSSGELSFSVEPDFENPIDADGNNDYDVVVLVTDGNGGISSQSITVVVTNANEDPVITSSAIGVVSEGQAEILTVSSADEDGGDPIYSISGGLDAALFSIDGVTGELAFVAAANFENPIDSDGDNVYELIVQVADGNGGFGSQTIEVTVTNVNEKPIITSSSSITSIENQEVVQVVTSDDVDGDFASYSIIGGDDAGLFSLDETSGELSFVVASDFENPIDVSGNNIYNIVIQVSDGNGGEDEQAITVEIVNVNESPLITSSDAFSGIEGQTAIGNVTSADVDNDTLSYSIVGGADSTHFSIDSDSGVLTFSNSPDFENPLDANADNIYDVVVEVVDGNGGRATQVIAVAVANVNEEPVITSVSEVSVLENHTIGHTVLSADEDGDSLIYSIVDGADSSLFSIDNLSGILTFTNLPDFENPSDADGDNVYEVEIEVVDGNGGATSQVIRIVVTDANDPPLIVSEGDDAGEDSSALSFSVDENQVSQITVLAIDEDAGSVLSYALTGGSDQSSFQIDSATGEISFLAPPNFEEQDQYEIELTVTDSGGLTSVKNIIIDVLDVNESPIALADMLEANENELLVIDAVASIISNDSDPDQDILTLVDFTQPENGTLVLNAQGNLEYKPNDGFVGRDVFDYVVEDTGGLQVAAQVSLDVRPLSDPILASALPPVVEFEETITSQPESMQITEPSVSMEIVAEEVEDTSSVNGEISDAGGLDEPTVDNGEEVVGQASVAVLIADVFSNSLESLFNAQSSNSDQQPQTTKQSAEKVSRVLQQILSYEVSNFNISFDVVGYEQNISPELREGILVIRDQIDQLVEESTSTSSLTTIAPSIVGASLTTGIVTWVLRSGLLVSATITSSPLWRPLDPVPILMQSSNDDESLFGHDEEADPGGGSAQSDQNNRGTHYG